MFSAWTETKEGPLCLVYAENSPDGSQKLRALRFLTLTLADMGLNPREDLQAQMLRQRSENSAQQLSVAIREDALLGRNGQLPTQAGGTQLEQALKPFLWGQQALRSSQAPDQAVARLLLPGATVEHLAQMVGQGRKVKVAELSDGGIVYGIYTEPPENPSSWSAPL